MRYKEEGKLDITDVHHPEKLWRTFERYYIPQIIASFKQIKKSFFRAPLVLFQFKAWKLLMKDPTMWNTQKTLWSLRWRSAPLGRSTAVSSWRLSAAATSQTRHRAPWHLGNSRNIQGFSSVEIWHCLPLHQTSRRCYLMIFTVPKKRILYISYIIYLLTLKLWEICYV